MRRSMDEKLYRQMLAVIDRYSFQIKIKDADGMLAFSGLSGDPTCPVLVRCLTMEVSFAYGSYPRGHVWHIPLNDLHRAVRKMSEADREFMWRARRQDLNRYDVERIFLEASHGIIRLNMY